MVRVRHRSDWLLDPLTSRTTCVAAFCFLGSHKGEPVSLALTKASENKLAGADQSMEYLLSLVKSCLGAFIPNVSTHHLSLVALFCLKG